MLANNDNDKQPVIHMRFNVKDLDKSESKKSFKGSLKFDRQTLNDFVDYIDKFKLKGLDGIEKVNGIEKGRYMDAMDNDGMEQGEEQIIYTSGVNMRDIRYINGINLYKTYSDDVQETFDPYIFNITYNM